jgi:hypothetical protein
MKLFEKVKKNPTFKTDTTIKSVTGEIGTELILRSIKN